MKKLVLSLLLAVMPLALFGASGTAIPGGNQAASFIINKPGAYYLAANRVMTTKGKPAIHIQAPDVTLDLNGYVLSFVDIEGAGNGIIVEGSNAEIRNGSISTVPYTAVFVASGQAGVRIIDLRVADSGGIKTNGNATWIERCHIIDSRGFGVEMGGWENVLKDCHIKNVQPNAINIGGYGVSVSRLGKVSGNIIGHTYSYGILCMGSYAVLNDNQVSEANLSKSTAAAGIVVEGDCVYLGGNVVHESYGMGIKLSGAAASCIVEKNVVCTTRATGPLIGAGIVSQTNSTILRGNLGTGNAGGLTAGTFIDGDNNLGN